MTGTIHEEQYTFFLSYIAQFFTIEIHILCSITFFAYSTAYQIMWKNTAEPGRPQMTTWRMRIA